jgi:hypothetical protein
MAKKKDPFLGFRVGDKVDFHSIINGPVTSENHTITHLEQRGGDRFCSKYYVAFITDKTGFVAIESLSRRYS